MKGLESPFARRGRPHCAEQRRRARGSRQQPPAEQAARLSITQITSADIRVLILVSEVDAENFPLAQEALLAPGNAPSRTVLDLGGVTFMDSSAISIRAFAHHHTTEAGGWLRMAAPTPPVQRVVRLVGLDTVIACSPALPEALTDSV
ncbi:STAS domain-containing protein [Streptomyces sp. NPDC002580]|uniref:STAS domain-containing protein n=1 Tax=Streptomyces sp. NPDC002580 TaxID=3364653 RepID=UPI00369471FE